VAASRHGIGFALTTAGRGAKILAFAHRALSPREAHMANVETVLPVGCC
jgi:hypothetical protein